MGIRGLKRSAPGRENPAEFFFYRQRNAMPVRRLITLGVMVLGVTLLVGVLIGTQTLRELNRGFDKLERSWVYADAVMEMNIGSFKDAWAALLSDHGRQDEARAAHRHAVALFETQYERALSTGVADTVNLHTVRRLYDEATAMVEEEITAGVEPGEAFHARMFSVQQQLDELLTRLEANGDEMMERETAHMVETVREVTRWLVLVGVLGILLCVVAGTFLTIRILRSLDRPVSLIASSTGKLTRAAQYHVKSAADQSSAMVQISSTMQQLVASFRDMTDRSHDMVRTSKDAAEECHKGHALLMDSQHGMEQIKREVGRITEHMRTLVEKSQQINGVLEMINELASQTNLLSINATIEAAGAGESGRRFAVVAEEIRLLAERAVEFTEEIRALIEDIQDTAHVTSAATAEGAQSVDRGLGKTSRIADNFDTLITLVTRTADAVQAIETTTREQVYSVEQVTEAVESLSHIASESEEQAGATLDAVEHLREVARDLQLIAGRKPASQEDAG